MIINDTLTDLIKEVIEIASELDKVLGEKISGGNILNVAAQIQRNKIMLEEFKMR